VRSAETRETLGTGGPEIGQTSCCLLRAGTMGAVVAVSATTFARCELGKAWWDKDLRMWRPLGNVAELSVSFRNFPFRSVSFRLFPPRSAPFRSVPRLGGGGTVCSQTVLLDTRTEHSPAGAVAPTGSSCALRNRKDIVGQGLTDVGLLAKRSVSFRFFPELSVSFRSVPLGSAWFRLVPVRSRPFAARPSADPLKTRL